jgi:hypothetical protein
LQAIFRLSDKSADVFKSTPAASFSCVSATFLMSRLVLSFQGSAFLQARSSPRFWGKFIILHVLPRVKRFGEIGSEFLRPVRSLYFSQDAGPYFVFMDPLISEQDLCFKHEEELYA